MGVVTESVSRTATPAWSFEQVCGQIGLGADRGNVVIRGDGAQGMEQLAVVRQDDETLADIGDDVMRRIDHLDAPGYRC